MHITKHEFDKLVLSYLPFMRQQSRKCAFTEYDREDFVSEIVTLAYKRRGNFDPDRGSFGTWIHYIARDVMTTWVRRHRMSKCVVCVGDAPFELITEPNQEAVVDLGRIGGQDSREAVLRAFGYTCEEIAAVDGVSKQRINQRTKRFYERNKEAA